MACNLAHTKVLHLCCRVFTKHLMCPQIPNLDELIGTGNDAQILQLEFEVVVGVLAPVDDCGNSMPASDLSSVDLRLARENFPFGAADEAGGLSRYRVLINRNKIGVHKDI